MRVMRRATMQRPLLHAVGDRARNLRIERSTGTDRRQKLFGNLFRKIFANRRLVKDINAVIANVDRLSRRRSFDRIIRNNMNGIRAFGIAHGKLIGKEPNILVGKELLFIKNSMVLHFCMKKRWNSPP